MFLAAMTGALLRWLPSTCGAVLALRRFLFEYLANGGASLKPRRVLNGRLPGVGHAALLPSAVSGAVRRGDIVGVMNDGLDHAVLVEHR